MNKFNLIFILSIALMFTSCIDENYDLGEIDDSNISIGDKISLPIGSTGDIKLSDFINMEDVNDLKIDNNGNYYIEYSGSENLKMPDMTLNNIISTVGINVPNGIIVDNLNFPDYKELNIPNTPIYEKFNFHISSDIKRVDSILLDITDINSSIELKLSLENILFSGENIMDIDFFIEMPDGFVIEGDNNFITIDEVSKRYILHDRFSHLEAINGKIKTYNFKISKLGSMTSSPTMKISSKFWIKKTGSITANSSKLKIDFNIKNPKISSLYGDVDIKHDASFESFGLSSMYEMFGDDAIVSFYDPRIRMNVSSNLGVDLWFMFGLKGYDKSISSNPVSNIQFDFNYSGKDKPSSNDVSKSFWIGNITPSTGEDVEFIKKDINSIIKSKSDSIKIIGSIIKDVNSGRVNSFIPGNPKANTEYFITIPFAPASDFKISMTDTLKGVFTSDIIDLVFKSGEVEIFGDITNTLPFNLDLIIDILNEEGNSTGVKSNNIKVGGSSDGQSITEPLSFMINESDMPKMKNARHIIIKAIAKSSSTLEGVNINEHHSLKLNLKIHKKGGINI